MVIPSDPCTENHSIFYPHTLHALNKGLGSGPDGSDTGFRLRELGRVEQLGRALGHCIFSLIGLKRILLTY